MDKKPQSVYTIRFSDCDLFGHLNNARYLDYFLNAREDHLKDTYQLELTDFYAAGTSWVVGSHEIYYLKPAVYNEVVTISSSLIQASATSLLVELQMHNSLQSQLKAIMWTNFIPINVKSGRLEAHGPAFMDFAGQILLDNSFVADGLKKRIADLRSGV